MIEERQLEYGDVREGLVVYVGESASECLMRGRNCVNGKLIGSTVLCYLCCLHGSFPLHEYADYTGLTTRLEIA